MADQPIGQLLDTLGVTADLDEGDLPVDALVILKVLKEDGTTSLVKGCSPTLDWITALGMATALQAVENSVFTLSAGDSDES